MLIDGGAGLGANVELLIEPSRLQMRNVEMLIATGYEIPEKVEMWAISRDFT